jgi:hypothetical protein
MFSERALEKFEEILKCRLFTIFKLRNFAKVAAQGSDPVEESRFILATNLYEEKVPKIRIRKRVTPRCEFNFVNMIKK